MGCCGSSKKRTSTPEQNVNQSGQHMSHEQSKQITNQKPKVGFWRRLFGH
ncbi:hypothetical protein [Vibrio marisflavi]|uniref:Calcium-binding protein n=1 Tax=Vibrio marisflavi CECT 7928 TaxID=634439 RepID=A0ABN8DZR5_9VIBR|nr:hypothetical protein [Vibrio marisflavi]CAH0535917.1 hypothetical protein VMF7928_00050 [Vibrio marisflavi CECT 7928]